MWPLQKALCEFQHGVSFLFGGLARAIYLVAEVGHFRRRGIQQLTAELLKDAALPTNRGSAVLCATGKNPAKRGALPPAGSMQ